MCSFFDDMIREDWGGIGARIGKQMVAAVSCFVVTIAIAIAVNTVTCTAEFIIRITLVYAVTSNK